MKKILIVFMAVIMILGSLNIVYARNNIDVAKGRFEVIGEILDDTASSILKAAGDVLQDLIDYTVGKFKDVKVGDWFTCTVSKLVGIGGIDGYPDGTFKPNNSITRAEFTKILVATLGHEDLSKTNNHWASGYISKAEDIKLADKGELTDIDRSISRNEMAKMCANALDYLGEDHVRDREIYKNQISDFNRIPVKYQDYVLKAYTKGIITGYPDGTFKGDQGLTRAEASTVVIRVIDESERVLPEKPSTEMPNEYGPNVDLNKVPLNSEAQVSIRGPKDANNPHNVDFSVLVKTWEPLVEQYTDTENLLVVRFGKDNSTVSDIMKYIKSKDVRTKELPYKEYTINGQFIAVMSNKNSQTIDLTVWR